VTVYTGNKRGAGTDADVYITLFGTLGDSGAIMLDDKKNNFESGQYVFEESREKFFFIVLFFRIEKTNLKLNVQVLAKLIKFSLRIIIKVQHPVGFWIGS
jgi:hypothetical protein